MTPHFSPAAPPESQSQKQTVLNVSAWGQEGTSSSFEKKPRARDQSPRAGRDEVCCTGTWCLQEEHLVWSIHVGRGWYAPLTRAHDNLYVEKEDIEEVEQA